MFCIYHTHFLSITWPHYKFPSSTYSLTALSPLYNTFLILSLLLKNILKSLFNLLLTLEFVTSEVGVLQGCGHRLLSGGVGLPELGAEGIV